MREFQQCDFGMPQFGARLTSRGVIEESWDEQNPYQKYLKKRRSRSERDQTTAYPGFDDFEVNYQTNSTILNWVK